MLNSRNRIIVVSGAHRSGTTWVGKILSYSNCAYVHEPFNIDIHTSPLKYWYHFIEENNNNKRLIDYLDQYVKRNFKSYINSIGHLRSKHDVFYFLSKIKNNLKYNNILIKDPLALFSLPWITRNYNTNNIILIRHPAAFVSSLKIKNWYFNLSNFLEQDLLINSVINPYKEEIVKLKSEKDIVKNAVLLWNITHHIILEYMNVYPDWLFVRHEDLSKNPLQQFNLIFNKIDKEFDDKTKEYILSTTNYSQENVLSNSSKVRNVNRNSSENINYWKERLTKKEIAYIKEHTKELSSKLYPNYEW